MKLTSILAVAGIAAAADYADFEITDLHAHQPNGDKFSYYYVEFNVTSKSGDSGPTSAYCYQWWGDSSGDASYSTAVPSGEWLGCYKEKPSEYDYNYESDITFQLYPYFTIGNFSLALRQNFTEIIDNTPIQMITLTEPYTITNTSSSPQTNCTINPFQNPWNIHASGDCYLNSPISLPVSSAAPACPHAKTVTLSFPIQVRTAWGESVYVVGSIPELGSWDLSKAVPLNADSYTSEPNGDIWTGGDVEVAAGTTFEWKAVQKNADGSWTWECGENWQTTVDEFTCGTQSVTENPTWFRCGNH